MAVFDVAIVGAGINGCATAYFLTKAGLSVALFDKEGIASGGSGAAGAFISPKISKSGPLKEVMDDAYAFSLSFYDTFFPQYLTKAPQLHIAKFDDENEKVDHFKKHTKMRVYDAPEQLESLLTEEAAAFASVYFEHSGIVDAEAMCRALASEAHLFEQEVTSLRRLSNEWKIGSVKAKMVLLATGAYDKVIDEPYINLRGVWGHRIDIRTSTKIGGIIHHKVSIAPTDDDGNSAIGATHNVHYHPQQNDEPYDIEAGRRELIEKALATVPLEEVEVVRDYVGLRSGSNDYMPIVGPLVNAAATLRRHPELAKGAKMDSSEYVYHKDLYMINGTGGYGFVLAPYLASQLCAHLTEGKPVTDGLEPSRFFKRWVKSAEDEKGR
jgi:tRNA 5-methylaminomethyl-2-thiouridine biosynthesis bifunctional protein